MIYSRTLFTDILAKSQETCVVFSYHPPEPEYGLYEAIEYAQESIPAELEIISVFNESMQDVYGIMLDEEADELRDKLFKMMEETNEH